MLGAATLAKQITGDVTTILGAYKLMISQFNALENWVAVFEHPKTINDQNAKNMIIDIKQDDIDISAAKTDWDAKQYYQIGMVDADMVYIGAIPDPQPMNDFRYIEFIQVIVFVYDFIMFNRT